MELDLDRLGEMHPKLQRTGEAVVYSRRGALALERSRHSSGAVAEVANGSEQARASMRWTQPAAVSEALEVIDDHRLTEDGAEAVALAFVHARSGWTAARRVQRDGFADWLLTNSKRARLALALEVSGTADGDADRRLKKKLVQVGRLSSAGSIRAALVVSFAEPRILAATTEGGAIP